MKQTLTFTILWAVGTPDKAMTAFADTLRRIVKEELTVNGSPPFDHFRYLSEFVDARHHKP